MGGEERREEERGEGGLRPPWREGLRRARGERLS
jgi:hypothetical protein